MRKLTIALVLVALAALALSAAGCGGAQPVVTTPSPQPTVSATPSATPGPAVNTYVELGSRAESDQAGVTVSGETNLANGAVVTAELFLFDDQGSWPKNASGGNLTYQQARLLKNVSVKGGKYSARFDLPYYAGGKVAASVEFYPYVGQPDFIGDAFGDKGQKMTGGRVVDQPPFDWGVIRRLDGFVYYLCPVIEFGWHPGQTPAPTRAP